MVVKERTCEHEKEQEEHVVETVCCPTKPKILTSSPYIEKSAYPCIEPLLTCSRTLCFQHTAQCLELYILSACQTELNDWWISWEKSRWEWSQFPFAFSRKLAFQNRTQNVCCLEHTLQLTQTQQPMTKNPVVKWPKASVLLHCQQQGQRSALLSVIEMKGTWGGSGDGCVWLRAAINFKMCWHWKSL